MSVKVDSAIGYTSSLKLGALNTNTIPRHVALIMDGNRRWAQARDLPLTSGYRKGAQALLAICSVAVQLGIKILTAYSFSIENWSRPREEVQALFELIESYCRSQKAWMVEQGVRLHHIGSLHGIPPSCRKIFLQTQEETKKGARLDLVLALNYGARDEIKRALFNMIDDVEKGKLEKSQISTKTISGYLDTKELCDPELIIRTSGEMRLSNFLLYQACYSELLISNTMWPEFTAQEFIELLIEYQTRRKRFGR